MQHEITARMPLLGKNGELTEPGFARKLLWEYRREDIRAGKTRIKEWDYYLIMNDRFALALTIADNSYMGMDSVSLLNFEEGWEITKSPMSFMPMGKTGMPSSSVSGDVQSHGRGHGLVFKNDGKTRRLIAHMNDFGDGAIYANIELTDEPEESMVIATPFDKPGHFYYNQKINCMRAKGEVCYNGRVYTFSPEDSFAVLDWGRGVWTWHNTWYWGSASGLVDGTPFGWNIGCGFGNSSAATENMLFYGGRAHKLEHIRFNIPKKDGRDDFMSPWTFTSSDGRFSMDFAPLLDRASCTDFGVLKSDQHQIFGKYTGTAVLDNGRVIEVRDLMGFAEKVENKW